MFFFSFTLLLLPTLFKGTNLELCTKRTTASTGEGWKTVVCSFFSHFLTTPFLKKVLSQTTGLSRPLPSARQNPSSQGFKSHVWRYYGTSANSKNASRFHMDLVATVSIW
jgi:hypothetical protein